MKSDSKFHRLHRPEEPLRLTWEGEEIFAAPGDNLAAALLAAGVTAFRGSPVSGAPRAPYCMMGACFECLVEVDGVPAVQACMTQVKEGMRIRRQVGRVDLADD